MKTIEEIGKYISKEIEIFYKVRGFSGSIRGILKTVNADGISIQRRSDNMSFLTKKEFGLITEIKLITTIFRK